jgi:tetratricopeptide (TPR) repeat protein
MQAFTRQLFVLTVFGLLQLSAQSKMIDSGWQYIATNELGEALRTLSAIREDDPDYVRAMLATAYIKQLLNQDEGAWYDYEKALRKVENRNPYLYAAMLTSRAQLLSEVEDDKGIITWLPQVLEEPDEQGLLYTNALARLGEYELEYASINEAQTYFDRLGALLEWQLIGPFENISASGFDKAFPVESEFNPKKTYKGKNGSPAQWFTPPVVRRDGWVDMRRYFNSGDAIFYGNLFVYSEMAQDFQLRVGTSGSLRAFLNDQLVLSEFRERNNDLDTYITATRLQAGWNRLLIKVGFSEINQCNFLVRLTDRRGMALNGLRFSLAEQEYKSVTNAPVTVIENAFETYFKTKIEQNPDHIENYLLLAETYLRNDKAELAEELLLRASAKMPKAVLVKAHLLEAYLRGEKYDEMETIVEEMQKLFPDIPALVKRRHDEFIEKEEFDKAREQLDKYEKLQPRTVSAYSMRMTMLFRDGNFPEALDLLNKAAKEYPANWDFAQTRAYLSININKSYKEAIDIYREYIRKYRKLDNAYVQLAQTYAQAGDSDGYIRTMKKLIEKDAAVPGILYSLAKSYKDMQDYEEAEEYIRKCLALCPGCADYHSFLAETKLAAGDQDAAIRSYENALRYDKNDYDAREKLRMLKEQKSVFDVFTYLDVDSLIANAPAAEAFPDDDAVVLLDDRKRVIYADGASESDNEILIKLFNSQAIEDLQEYYVDYSGYSQRLIFDKAIVRKPDGSEIAADVSGGTVVFKSAEPGDFLYIKYKQRNYNGGILSEHVWERVNFNYFYPINECRYAVVVPEGYQLFKRTQNMDIEVQKKMISGGELRYWWQQNEAALVGEYGMPYLDDIGKVLHLSSIPNWELIVDWYRDLSRNKTRSTIEIKAAVKELFAGRENLDDRSKMRLIYNFITENIQYSFVNFRQSGLIPQSARKVLVQRIGDCKDVATLCLAMLNEVGIEGHYVLVNTFDEGRNTNVLPGIEFNHAIVGVDTESGPVYMDLTARNFAFGSVPPNDLEAFSLAIKPGVDAPFYLDREFFAVNGLLRDKQATLNADLRLDVQVKSTRLGILAAYLRDTYRFLGEKAREREMIEALASDHPSVTIDSLAFTDLDSLTLQTDYEYHYSQPVYAEETGALLLVQIPWSDAAEPFRGISYNEREQDLYYRQVVDTLYEKVVLVMPKGYQPLPFEAEISFEDPAGSYLLTTSFSKGKLVAERRLVWREWLIEKEKYAAFRDFYNNIVRADARKIVFQK